MLVVAIARLAFDTSPARSLKEKRSIARKILGRVRSRFRVSAAEIEALDDLSMFVMGVAVVSNDARYAVSVLDRIVDFADGLYLAPLLSREREVMTFSRLEEPFWDLSEGEILSWEELRAQTKEIPDETVPGPREGRRRHVEAQENETGQHHKDS